MRGSAVVWKWDSDFREKKENIFCMVNVWIVVGYEGKAIPLQPQLPQS